LFFDGCFGVMKDRLAHSGGESKDNGMTKMWRITGMEMPM